MVISRYDEITLREVLRKENIYRLERRIRRLQFLIARTESQGDQACLNDLSHLSQWKQKLQSRERLYQRLCRMD